jgi:oxygen-independent coproporphyrinogen-3 oxidase
VQNIDRWEEYIAALDRGELPVGRALPVTPDQLLIREVVLLLKTGRLELAPIERKFGVDVRQRFAEALARLEESGDLTLRPDAVEVTRQGLLHVDRLLPAFFEPEHRVSRYA